MRVLFVFPDLAADVTNYTGVPSYGVAVLSAVLKQAGHEVALAHLTTPPTAADFRECVRAARPDLVAFSCNSHYAQRLSLWSAWAKEASRAPVIVGGVHATLAPEQVAADPHVDFVCVGEGEGPLPELCAALAAGLDPTRIANLWARSNGGFVRNRPRPLLTDLDALPDPDFGLFDYDRLYHVRRGLFPFLMSRGCAYSCTYCCSHALREITAGGARFWRFQSPDHATSQLARMMARHQPGAARVHFHDTILFARHDWLEDFARLYRARVGLPFSCNLRADMVTPETADLLASMGCETIRFGVECGDEELNSGLLNRGHSLGDVRRAFALTRERGISRVSYNLVGLPGETLARALATVRLNAELAPDLALPFIFYPYPGTRLRRLCEKRGYLTGAEFDHYLMGSTVRLPGFCQTDILFVQRFFVPLLRLHALARRWPPRLRRAWWDLLAAVAGSPLLPRGLLVAARDRYKALRHRAGEWLVARHPRLYLRLGGTDPL